MDCFNGTSRLGRDFFAESTTGSSLYYERVDADFPAHNKTTLLSFPCRFTLPFPLIGAITACRKNFHRVQLFTINTVKRILQRRVNPHFHGEVTLHFGDHFYRAASIAEHKYMSVILFIAARFLTSHSIALSCLIRVFTSIYRLTDKPIINGNGMAKLRSETNDFLITALHPLF